MAASGSLVSLAMYTHFTIQEKEHQAHTTQQHEYNPVSTNAGLDKFLNEIDEFDDETSRTTESDMDMSNNEIRYAIV